VTLGHTVILLLVPGFRDLWPGGSGPFGSCHRWRPRL